MYSPKPFAQDDVDNLENLITQYPFATVITSPVGADTDSDGNPLVVDHMPMLLAHIDEKRYLQAHIAKANSLWRTVESGSEARVVFHGPNAYVSPNYYPTKLHTGRVVPTWNYSVVHVCGIIRFVTEKNWLVDVVSRLTSKHEAQQPMPWRLEDAPAQYINRLVEAIVGVEIEITALTGKWKLSQNQPAINQEGVVAGLAAEPDQLTQRMSDWMVSERKKS